MTKPSKPLPKTTSVRCNTCDWQSQREPTALLNRCPKCGGIVEVSMADAGRPHVGASGTVLLSVVVSRGTYETLQLLGEASAAARTLIKYRLWNLVYEQNPLPGQLDRAPFGDSDTVCLRVALSPETYEVLCEYGAPSTVARTLLEWQLFSLLFARAAQEGPEVLTLLAPCFGVPNARA